MGKRIAEVDAYIRKAQPYAQPILKELRERVHAACPEAEEVIRWGMPDFDYKGILCGMAAFKEHAIFGFWKHALMVKRVAATAGLRRDAMGSFGRLTSVVDLSPRREFAKLVKLAMKLNDEGVKNPVRSNPKPKPAIRPPAAFTAALRANKQAKTTFDAFPPSQKREYLEWITEARTTATREKRIAAAIEWMAEGKRRQWKYESRKK